MGNIIKKEDISSKVLTKDDLKRFFTNIQPQLYYIAKEMQKCGIQSISPCITSDGKAVMYVENYELVIREDGFPVIKTDDVVGEPFPGVDI